MKSALDQKKSSTEGQLTKTGKKSGDQLSGSQVTGNRPAKKSAGRGR